MAIKCERNRKLKEVGIFSWFVGLNGNLAVFSPACDEGCTRELMMDMDELENKIDQLHFDPSNINITGPYIKLNKIRNETRILSVSMEAFEKF